MSNGPKHFSIPVHGTSVVSQLLIDGNRILSASDDLTILVHELVTGDLLHELRGHTGGVWALAVWRDTLVSGSTDGTIRLWDLTLGTCTHVYEGHTNNVRCLATTIAPRGDGQGGELLLVSGSKDRTLRVWTFPSRPTLADGYFPAPVPIIVAADDNAYHRLCLTGHEGAVRDVAVRGRLAVSGSYDCTVRVEGVVLDHSRQQVYSGSMDNTVKIWSLTTGECLHTLSGHQSLVGLSLSPSYLVSGSADSTLRIWDPATGELVRVLEGHAGAILALRHDDRTILSASDGALRMWDTRTGKLIRDLLTAPNIAWANQVAFQGQWCVAVSWSRAEKIMMDIWHFGDSHQWFGPGG